MLVPFFAALVLVSRLPDSPPPPPPTNCVRYYALEDIKPEAIQKALTDLEGRLVTGPSTATCRPKISFVAVEVNYALGPKDVARALKKSCKSVEELAWTTFRGVDRPLPSIMGVSSQDCVIGMASDMRWFETKGDAKHFYYVPGKLDAASIAKQFGNLFEPFNAGDIGTLATESLTIEIAATADPHVVKKAVKTIEKFDGVRKAELVGRLLQIRVELDGMRASSVSPADSKSSPSFFAKPFFDVLGYPEPAAK